MYESNEYTLFPTACIYAMANLWCFHCPRVKGTCGWKQIYSIHTYDLRVTPWAKPWYNLHNTTKQLKMYRISITKFAHLHPLFSIYHFALRLPFFQILIFVVFNIWYPYKLWNVILGYWQYYGVFKNLLFFFEGITLFFSWKTAFSWR